MMKAQLNKKLEACMTSGVQAGSQREILSGGAKTDIEPLCQGLRRKLVEDQIKDLHQVLVCKLNYC